MSLNRTIVFALTWVAVASIYSSVSNAQITRPMRWAGHGFSDGYHRCTPGPNSDYYNPYTVHNSLLIHQNPAAYDALPNRFRSSGPLKPGVPFWEYAAPAQSTQRSDRNSISGGGNIVPRFGRPVSPDEFAPSQPFNVHWENHGDDKAKSESNAPTRDKDSAMTRLQKNFRVGQRLSNPPAFQKLFSKKR